MQQKALDTTNAEHLLFNHGMLEITILGGIRLDGLDRMRVTLKIRLGASPDTVGGSEVPPLRHNLDLYNDTQVEKLIRKTAEKLEIGTSVIGAALADLTDLLEQYRLEEVEKQNTNPQTLKTLSESEAKAAQLYLSSPNLMERTKEDIGNAGVIGEEHNRLLMYLIFTSRKRDNPLHVISLGSSGIGKTHLQEKVASLIPEEDKLEITTLSSNAFYYFGQQELRNKLILIEDLDGTEEVLYPLREIQSKKRITKTVVVKNTKGETRTVSLVVEGPVCVAGCTTKESLYEDNANRSFLLYIDESKEQDSQIMDYQRKLSAGKIDLTTEHQIREQFRDMQRVLHPVQIRNPYAEQLLIPDEVFKPRRSNAHYLAFIEAVTFYHQYQREKQHDKETGEEFIETTLEDIEEANKLMKDVLLRKSDELTGACRNYFESLKTHLQESKQEAFTNREMSRVFRLPISTVKRYHLQLEHADRLKREGKKATGYHYQVVSFEEYQQLQTNISSVLDQLTGSLAAQQGNEPAKSKKTSKKSEVA